jgi:hypothetical protein
MINKKRHLDIFLKKNVMVLQTFHYRPIHLFSMILSEQNGIYFIT